MHNFDGVLGDARKKMEAADAERDLVPFNVHPQCAYCQRRYDHTHVVQPGVRMAKYPGSDPT